jgi:hypothetical protein
VGFPAVNERVTTPAPRDIWWHVAAEDPHALAFGTPAWTDCICASGDYEDASRLYEMADGHTLVLPLVRQTRLPQRLAIQASLPRGWGVGGLLGDRPIATEDVAAVFADLAHVPALSTAIRPNPLLEGVWASARPHGFVAVPHVSHVLDLEGGFAAVWSKRITTATRTKLRRAERSGLLVERATADRGVPIFYGIYERWLERRARERRMPLSVALWRGRRREPLRKFEAVAAAFGEACRVWIAWLDSMPVAAAIVLVHGANAIYWRSTSDRELAGSTRANDLLLRVGIKDACMLGCHYYHMGESGGVESLMHFKSRFGASPYSYSDYRLERLPISSAQRAARGLSRAVEGWLLRSRTAA